MKAVWAPVIMAISAAAWAEYDVWAPIPGGGTSYPMATKYTPSSSAEGNDGLMCWAATASDLIEYWQQRYVYETGNPLPAGIPTGSADSLRQSQVFDTFVQYWTNSGRGVEPGFYWYFSGCLAANAQNDVTGEGGYWKDYCAQLGYAQTYDGLLQNSYCKWMSYTLPSMGTTTQWKEFVNAFDGFITDSLQGGSLVALSMSPPSEGGEGHVITLYGAKYNDDGDILGVYVHENNNKNGEIIYMELERELLSYYFEDDKTGNYEKGEYIRLKLLGNGSTANGWYIGNVASLDLRIMPEPATTTLSLLGLSLLLTRRRRRSS